MQESLKRGEVMGQRIMIYDATTLKDGVDWKEDGLAYTWFAGGRLYRWLRWLDKVKAVTSWDEALDYLIEAGAKEEISQVQFWGHGLWGSAYIGRDRLSTSALKKEPIREKIHTLSNLMSPGALWWFRTCQTYGTEKGHAFAKEFTNAFGCRTAASTHIIGPLQSGCHSLLPGQEPHWSVDEGVESRPEGKPPVGKWSSLSSPNTIFALQGHLPSDW